MTQKKPEETPNQVFAKGKYRFDDDPRLDELTRDLHTLLDFRNHASDIVPTESSRFSIGSQEKPYKGIYSRGVSVYGTGTVANGVLNILDKGVVDFGTNSSMLVIPVYTGGKSPFDIWHPASGYMRDGAMWLQKA